MMGRALARWVRHAGCASGEQRGFTLLEVIVALTILSLAIVTLIQLSSQSLRLVKTSDDYQQAAQLADRLVAGSQPSEEAIDTGEEGRFRWERRASLVPMPDELQPPQTLQPTESPKLFAVTIAVRWGENQTLEMATLYIPTTPPTIPSSAAIGGQLPRTTPTTGIPQQSGSPGGMSQQSGRNPSPFGTGTR